VSSTTFAFCIAFWKPLLAPVIRFGVPPVQPAPARRVRLPNLSSSPLLIHKYPHVQLIQDTSPPSCLLLFIPNPTFYVNRYYQVLAWCLLHQHLQPLRHSPFKALLAEKGVTGLTTATPAPALQPYNQSNVRYPDLESLTVTGLWRSALST
jgi:hypothetical protein